MITVNMARIFVPSTFDPILGGTPLENSEQVSDSDMVFDCVERSRIRIIMNNGESHVRCRNKYHFIKQVTENIALPCMVGLDYTDVKNFFNENPKTEVKIFRSNSIKDLLKKANTSNPCFFVMSVSLKVTLDDISRIGEAMLYEKVFWGARMNDKQRTKFVMTLVKNET